MKKTKLVTSLYSDATTKKHPYFAHEPYAREERYFHSLRTLNNMETEIVCYCNEIQYEQIVNYIDKFELSNVTVKISNLDDFKYSKKMKEIKEKSEDFNFYHEIDWNKLFLLEKEFDESYDYIYWIDVGLSHHGLFPNRFHPNSDLITGMSYDYYTYSFTKIFNKDFINGLNSFLNDKLLTINYDTYSHSIHDLNFILEDNLSYDGLSVGGILGGHVSKIKWFIDTFYVLGEKSLSKDYILNHESIISYIKEKYPENFNSFKFKTWYHEDTPNMPDYIKESTSFANFFDFIFDKFINFKENSIK